ncbi:MAG: DUF3556 domain-containing protein [Candidatus Dormiibacterota bacterium]
MASLLAPLAPPYDAEEWDRKPFPEKARMVCGAWAIQGYGSPIGVYAAYGIKVLLYIGGWMLFCSFTPGLGGISDIGTWIWAPEAFQKAIIWSMLFESLGLGCGSGPLTGRYFPPVGGPLYWLRPGTTKLPVFEGVPLIGGRRRTILDVFLYAAYLVFCLNALLSAHPGGLVLVAIVVSLAVLGILDKTLFLAARGEHYWTTVMIFVVASNWIPGAKAVQASLWFFAGFSKLNHHFPSVVGVMTSNSPFTRFAFIRKRMYRSYPDDLSPSRLATWMAHAGTFLELSVPVVLLLGHGGPVTYIGLGMMLALHLFITSNVPMGVPIEWNFMVVYAAFFLFWKHADVSIFDMNAASAVVVVVMCVLVPLLGNLFPSRVPFLMAMRYYAGNWAYSIWLFRDESHTRLEKLTKSAPWVYDQLHKFYDHRTALGLFGKVMAFRLMHLHGKALPQLLPKAVDNLDDYEWIDGEVIAGIALGWNFGDGHLHNEQLLRSLQAQCGFEPGELRVIMVESQPLGRNTLHDRIHDAATGLIEQGHVDVRELRKRQPWAWTPAPASPTAPKTPAAGPAEVLP